MNVTFEPLLNNLLLTVEPEVEQSSVIQVVRQTEGLARFGTVRKIGPEVRDVKPGQRVLASLTAGVELPGGLTMIAEEAVLGVVHQ